MNSSSARVTAAFFVRSPLTLTACSMSFGSSERLVAMCHLSHTSLHIEGRRQREFLAHSSPFRSAPTKGLEPPETASLEPRARGAEASSEPDRDQRRLPS